MKVFFDANVIISGFATRGYSFDVIKDAVYKHEVYYTEHLLKEIQRVLPSKFPLSGRVIHFAIFIIKKYFTKSKTAGAVEKICRDPDDNQILADALMNNIDVIITGDRDLLVLKTHKGIKIISPKEYWNL